MTTLVRRVAMALAKRAGWKWDLLLAQKMHDNVREERFQQFWIQMAEAGLKAAAYEDGTDEAMILRASTRLRLDAALLIEAYDTVVGEALAEERI